MKMRRKKVKRYEAEAYDLRDRIVANGGTIQEDSLDAVTAFVTSCKNAGIWSKFFEVGLFVGDQLAAALVKLKFVTAGVLVNQNFVAGDYTERGVSGGLTGNGTTKYLKTGIVPTVLNAQYVTLAFYLRTTPSGVASLIGAGTNFLQFRFGFPPRYEFQWSAGAAVNIAPANAPAFHGLAVASRLGAGETRGFVNGAEVTTDATVRADSLANVELFLFESNNAGAPAGSKLNATGSFYLVSQALTGAEQLYLYAAVQALQGVLGRALDQ